jgi:hypothetical protein
MRFRYLGAQSMMLGLARQVAPQNNKYVLVSAIQLYAHPGEQ